MSQKVVQTDFLYCEEVVELTKLIRNFKQSSNSDDPAEISDIFSKGIKLLERMPPEIRQNFPEFQIFIKSLKKKARMTQIQNVLKIQVDNRKSRKIK